MFNSILSIFEIIFNFISNITAVLIGAIVAFGTIWYKQKIDKEKEIQEWFKEFYA